ncbi:hypothetical protein L1887_10044 [Cichorium endivia]|nr:hypothetical protein L1887_10044 [Cichorium endivia]
MLSSLSLPKTHTLYLTLTLTQIFISLPPWDWDLQLHHQQWRQSARLFVSSLHLWTSSLFLSQNPNPRSTATMN